MNPPAGCASGTVVTPSIATPLQAPDDRPTAALSALAMALTRFFEHHGIWAPGVRLFRRIGFRAKALIIALTFLLPITELARNYFGSQNAQIGFSAKERLGIVHAQATMPLLQTLVHLRQPASPEGSTDSSAAEAHQAVLNERLSRLAAAEAAHGGDLGTASAHAAVEAALLVPAGGVATSPASGSQASGVQALIDLIGAATDGSNLTLDPDIDTYYLMDAAMFRLPVIADAASQIRLLGDAVLAAGSITPAQTRRIVEQLALLTMNQSALVSGLGKAAAYNPDIAAAVPLAPQQAALHALVNHVEVSLLDPAGPGKGTDRAAHAAVSGAAIAAGFDFGALATGQLDALIARRVDGLQRARDITAAVLALGLLAAAYLFNAFRQVLNGGLREVAFHIEAMRDGDLTTRPHAWGADEAASLMHTLAQMQLSLRTIVRQVRTSSDRIVGASGEIASGACDLSARTEQSAASLQQTASAMEQMAATVQRNQGSVDDTTRLALSNAEAAERGGRVIGQVAQTMQSINASSERIGDIVGTIDGIAFQTNLLALNAAVEAARAGEQGRGFAVVASEVRALAQRSAAAAREIKSLIAASTTQVEGGVRIVTEADAAIREIVGSAQRMRQLLADVAVSAREQSLGVSQSAVAVQALDTVTQQNAALVEQTAAAAGALRDQAQALAGEVARFRLPAAGRL